MSKNKSLVDSIAAAIEKHFGGSAEEDTTIEVIKSVNEELMQATHIVAEPLVRDMHDQYYTAETIRKGCHNFNSHCQTANLFHRVNTELVTVAESYILPVSAQIGDEIVKAGTWISVLQYHDTELWEMEKSGDIQGVSLKALGNLEK